MKDRDESDRGFEIIEDVEAAVPAVGGQDGRWKLLVVDDDEAVHSVTRIALSDFEYADRGLQLLHAYSGAEAKALLREHEDIALMLLDVVMESDEAGLEVARFVREELDNPYIRLVLRTGQPGLAPERDVVTRYDINDYKHKTELTRDRLFTVLYTSLSSYRQLRRLQWQTRVLDRSRAESARIAHAASHQLKAPLLSIRRFTELMRKRYADKLDPDGRALVDLAMECVDDMNGLMADLATLTAADGDDIRFQPVSADDLLHWSIRKLAARGFDTSGIISRAPLPTLQGEHGRLLELFGQVLENALKFRGDSPARVQVTATAVGAEWDIRVTDAGVGIPDEAREQVFDAFSVAHDGSQPVGNGIGLAIARKIVQQHGGSIRAEPAPGGEGTSIVMRLPGEQSDVARFSARSLNPPA